MIEILNGMTETINYGSSLGVRLYHNVDYEDYPEHWHVGLEIIMPVSSEYTVIVGKERFRLMTGDQVRSRTLPGGAAYRREDYFSV